jgi:hypothetical protein
MLHCTASESSPSHGHPLEREVKDCDGAERERLLNQEQRTRSVLECEPWLWPLGSAQDLYERKVDAQILGSAHVGRVRF